MFTGRNMPRALLLAMSLAGAATAAPAAPAAHGPAADEASRESDDGRGIDWRLLAVAGAGLLIGRIVVTGRARPRHPPRR